MTAEPILQISDIRVQYGGGDGRLVAVDKVTFDIHAGESVALVGESGSGKSSLARAIVGIVPFDRGSVSYAGHQLTRQGGRRRPPWTEIQMVFQDPGGSLDPRKRVGAALAEVLRLHGSKSEYRDESAIAELLMRVGLAADVASQVPARLSGGQRQRAAIALALAARPKLLICDEAVSALDVSIRAQILRLLSELQHKLGLSYLFITHDLHVARQISDRVLIMYGGQIVESGPTSSVLEAPRHPYTRLLVAAIPSIDKPARREREILPTSDVPTPKGCVFASRCPYATDESRTLRPTLESDRTGRAVACHSWEALPTLDAGGATDAGGSRGAAVVATGTRP